MEVRMLTSMKELGDKQEEQLQKSRNRGSAVVITGGLAAMILWVSVLASGMPIEHLGGTMMSYAYALAVCCPAAIVSLFSIFRLSKSKMGSRRD